MASAIESKMSDSIDSEFVVVSDGEEEKERAIIQFSLGGGFPMQDPDIAEIQRHILELGKQNKSLKEDVTSTNVRLKEHLKNTSEWQSEMNAAQKELEGAHSRIEELKNGNLELRQQSISLSQEKEVVKNQLKETQTKVSEYLQLIGRQNEEISNLKALSETKENENSDLKSQLVDLKIRCESMESQLKSYQETIDQMKKLDEKQVNLRTAMQESFDTFISKVEKERMNHSETDKLLRDLQEDYGKVVKFLQIRLKDETEKNEQLQREHEVKTKIAVAQIDDQAAELLDKKLQMEDRDEKIKTLSECLEATIEELNEIQIHNVEGALEAEASSKMAQTEKSVCIVRPTRVNDVNQPGPTEIGRPGFQSPAVEPPPSRPFTPVDLSFLFSTREDDDDSEEEEEEDWVPPLSFLLSTQEDEDNYEEQEEDYERHWVPPLSTQYDGTRMAQTAMYQHPATINQANAAVATPMQVTSSVVMGPSTASFNTSQQMVQTVMYQQPAPMNQANAAVATPMQVTSSAIMGPSTASFNTSQQMAQTVMYQQPIPMNQANVAVATAMQVPSFPVSTCPSTAAFNTSQQVAQTGMHPHLAMNQSNASAAPPMVQCGQSPNGYNALNSSGLSHQPPPNPLWTVYGQQTSVAHLLFNQYAQATSAQNQHVSNYPICQQWQQ